MSRARTAAVVAVVGVVVASVVAGASLLRPREADAEEAAASAASSTSTAAVTRRTLESTEELDGTLAYQGGRGVHSGKVGTVTWVAAEGRVVTRGEKLYEVDGEGVTLMYGRRPAWRAMGRGTEGADVLQLERNLKALGYADGDMKVDGEFDAETEEAVEAWQKDAGLEQDGVVDLGEVVFLPDAVRIQSLTATLGSALQPGSEVLQVTSRTKVVTVEVDADRADLLKVGDTVGIRLPNGRETRGKVSAVSSVAQGGSDGQEAGMGGGGQGAEDPTLEVTITLDDPRAARGLDGGPVDVSVARNSRENVLTVPVNALLALLGGGYAIEVVDGSGATRLVEVEVGLFADGYVEISGAGVREGDRVVVPS